MYRQLAVEFGDGAHSRYNALIRRVVSFRHAAGVREGADRRRIDAFLTALARIGFPAIDPASFRAAVDAMFPPPS